MPETNGVVKPPTDNAGNYPARSMPPVKFKDKPGRGGIMVPLVKTFGFLPEVLVIQKVAGKHDTIIVSALIKPDDLKKEEPALVDSNGKEPAK